EDIEAGDRIIIQSGEQVAIDGIVVSGQAHINEAAITGESVPAGKKVDDQVFSGTIVDNGYIEVIAEKVGDDTAFSKIIELVEEKEAGDRIIIQSGEQVAIDGIVVSGQAHINEAAITGESVPAGKKVDDQVFSGTIVDNGYIEVIAEKVGDDTAFSKIIELVEEAQEGKARTQKFLERFANVYTPGILVLSVIVFIFTRNIELTLTFLVIACPGALVISAPVSL